MNLALPALPPSSPNEWGPDRSATAIWGRATAFMTGLMLAMSLANAAHAETTHERIALILSGQDCPAQRDAIMARLARIEGITRVDLNILPDHVMIDRVHDRLTAEDLAALLNEVMAAHGQCRADVMKSCITADVVHASSR